MFDAVRNNKRIVQFFLALITLPFAFWGVDSYFRSGTSGNELANVGGSRVTQQDFAQSMREQQERLRNQSGREFNPAMLETPEARAAILDSLVAQRVLLLHAAKHNLAAHDMQLREVIGSIQNLQEDGKFSMRRYEQALRAQGMTQTGFEAKLRQDLTIQQVVQAVSDTSIVSSAAAARLIAVQLEERDVSEAVIRPESFAGQVKLSADAVRTYYETNRGQYEIPQQIRAEFVVLSLEAIAAGQVIKPEELAKRFEDEVAGRIRLREEVRKKVEAILFQLKADPEKFAELAKAHSQDPGSAAKGGDLGFFPRGAMVKPFEDAVFKLKEGQTSGIVESEYGFHIIRLAETRKGQAGEERRASHILLTAPAAPADAVKARAEIEREMKRQAAAKLYAEASEAFSNMVYEQPDALNPAAEKYKLEIHQTSFFDKTNRAAAGPLAGNEKLFNALFSDDALKNRRNTEAIEVAPSTLVAARVRDIRPAELRQLDVVKAEIEKKLIADAAAELARKDGEAKLARLVKGESAAMTWAPQQTVLRQPMRGLDPDAQRIIFKASIEKLPTYVGHQSPNGTYVIYRIAQARTGTAKGENDPQARMQRMVLQQLTGAEDFNTYLSAKKERYGVKVDLASLNKSDEGPAPASPAPARPRGKF